MSDQDLQTNRFQLSLAAILFWITCVAIMFQMNRMYLKDVAQRNAIAVYVLLGLHAMIHGTKIAAAIAWIASGRWRQVWTPGEWLLFCSLFTFLFGLCFRLLYLLENWDGGFAPYRPLYLATMLTYFAFYSVSAVLLVKAAMHMRACKESRLWQTLFWFICLWKFLGAAAYLLIIVRGLDSLSSQFAVHAFNVEWNWFLTTTATLLAAIAMLTDRKERVQRDKFHWCGAVTFGLSVIWTMLYRLATE